MNALQVHQAQSFVSMNNQNSLSGTPPNSVGVNGTQIFTVGDPADLQQAFSSLFGALPQDYKVFLRQQKLYVIGHNHGLEPFLVTMVHFRVRRQICGDDFSNYTNLFQNQSISMQSWNAVKTTSNPAQRYLKFTKTKKKIVNPNQMIKFKISTPRYRGRPVSGDVELNTLYIGTKITRGVLIHVDPIPQPFITGTGTSGNYVVTSVCPALYQLNLHLNMYTSMYGMGFNDPQSLLADIGTVTGSRIFSITQCNASTVTTGQPWSTGG